MITEIVGLKNSSSDSPEIIAIRDQRIAEANQAIKSTNLSIISQDCLGGVIYHDTGNQFLSPTINLWFSAQDFVKMAQNLVFYLGQELQILSDTPPVVGLLYDVKVNFAHYETGEAAKIAWDRRNSRLMLDKILIMCTDRFGFKDAEFEEFKKITYPKILVTGKQKWANHDFVVYLPQYENAKHIGQTIPLREFYHEKIFATINSIAQN